MMKLTKKIIKTFTVFLIFFFLAIYITYPLIFHMGDITTGHGDELIIAWIQNWVIHSMTINPLTIFDTNLFYPYKNTLTYSDLHFTSSLLSIIPLYFIKEPIGTLNFTLLSSIVMVPFSIFLLSKYLTKNYIASFLSGILVQFSPAFLDKKVHIQVLALEWIPLSVLFFILFHKKKQTRYLVLSLVFFLMQTYNSFMTGYFLIFFFVLYICFMFFRDRQSLHIFTNKRNIAVIFVALALLIPIIIPYYQTSIKYHATRDIRDAVHFAIQPEDLLYSNEHTKLQMFLLNLPLNQHSQNGEFKPGYLGLVFTLLSIFTIFFAFIKTKKKDLLLKLFTTTSLVGLLLSFGPALHLCRKTTHIPFPIPLPYTLFYYILPGFQGFRNSARFEMMFILFIAIAIAIILAKSLKRTNFMIRNTIYIFLIFGVFIEYGYPMKFQPVPQKNEFPEVFNWLNTTPKNSASIIMPIYNWNMPGSSAEFMRDYYSTANWRRTANGISGYTPPTWEKLVVRLHYNFPDISSIKELKELGINYIIIDKSAYDKNVYDTLKTTPSLRLIKSIQNFHVFEFKH